MSTAVPILLLTILLALALPARAAAAGSAAEPAGTGSETAERDAGNPDAAAAEAEPTLDERLDALLEATPEADDYRETSNCLFRRQYRSVKVLNQNYLLFYRNQNYWLNRVRRGCAALRRNKMLTFASHGSSVCRGDQIYVSDRLGFDQSIDSTGRPRYYEGVCFLGEFETISAEQAAMLLEVTR